MRPGQAVAARRSSTAPHPAVTLPYLSRATGSSQRSYRHTAGPAAPPPCRLWHTAAPPTAPRMSRRVASGAAGPPGTSSGRAVGPVTLAMFRDHGRAGDLGRLCG
jgi:hypothetical protein